VFRVALFFSEGILLTFLLETFKNVEKDLGFIATAGKVLSSSLDYNVTLNTVANLVVLHKADLCIIDLLEKNGKIRHAAIVDADKTKREMFKDILESPPNPKGKQGIYEVARTRRPLLISPVTASWIRSVSKDKEDEKTWISPGLWS